MDIKTLISLPPYLDMWNKFEELSADIGIVEVGEPVWTITALDKLRHPREDLAVVVSTL